MKFPPVIVKLPSECIALSLVFKLKIPPLITNSILLLVSFVDTFIPFGLCLFLLTPDFKEPFLFVLILKSPSFIVNFLLAIIPSLYELILKFPPLIVIKP